MCLFRKPAKRTLQTGSQLTAEMIREHLRAAQRSEARKKHLIEQRTKAYFIEPFFRLFGFDFSNPASVVTEKELDKRSTGWDRVDYALYYDGQPEDAPSILVEAKKKNEPLDKKKYRAQLEKYFTCCKSAYTLIQTNGIEYRFYSIEPGEIAVGDQSHSIAVSPFFSFSLGSEITDDIVTALLELSECRFRPDRFIHEAVLAQVENNIHTALEGFAADLPDDVLAVMRSVVKCPDSAVGDDELRGLLSRAFGTLGAQTLRLPQPEPDTEAAPETETLPEAPADGNTVAP